MRERGGVWVAHGSGEADRAVVDVDDRILVPPDGPSYALRRLWLTQEEAAHYYEGFANEGLWPLCHEAHVRPVFRTSDWKYYQEVNDRFSAVIEQELPDLSAPVFIQDYHLTLVAKYLRAACPDVRIALFVGIAMVYGPSMVWFRADEAHRPMPLVIGFGLVAIFIWFAENLGTFARAWAYPGQEHGWQMVSLSKLGSWYLLMIISFVLVAAVHGKAHRAPGGPRIEDPEAARRE